MAAKQATTIDHISGGRFALNVVGGWYTPELEMFGAPLLDHDSLYAYAAEWLDVARLLWTREDEWDYEGRFFTIRKGFHEPKPIQQPFPPIMNAGGSVTGRRFAAKYADMVFIGLGGGDVAEARAQIDALRTMAREEFGRTVQVWTSAYAICRPTEREARDYFRYYTEERGDREAVENLVRVRINQPDRVSLEDLETMKSRMIAGWGGYPLIGTAEQIVDRLLLLSQAGLDGLVLSWVNYQVELEQWIAEVLPLMEQADLRAPFRPRTQAPARP
jgi:alkanesulfonate monooxygenase SsuD/methylene tetrahydromethanopterin reductase-like flavin-dependent oxidoreductase (luciferase family)